MGVNLSKMGGANSNFEILQLGLPEYFRCWIASGGSNPARRNHVGNQKEVK